MSLANAGYRELPGYFVTKKMVKFHDLFANCWLEALAGVMTGVWRVQWETEVLQSGHTTSQSSERLKYYRVATPPPSPVRDWSTTEWPHHLPASLSTAPAYNSQSCHTVGWERPSKGGSPLHRHIIKWEWGNVGRVHSERKSLNYFQS